jgi:DNA-binding CsgD family transcriptional regulator
MQEQIISLRMSGMSIKRISSELKCSKSTVSRYCRNLRPNNTQTKNELIKSAKRAGEIFKKQWDEKKLLQRQQAEEEWMRRRCDYEFILFIGLYWGEGNKTNGQIRITNNDPGIIKIAMSQLLKLKSDAKLVATIKCYPDHDLKECNIFWRNLLPGVRIDMRLNKDKRSGKRRSPFGLCSLWMNDWKLYTKILSWIEICRR